MERSAIIVESEIRVVTERSVWLVRPTTYLRLPRQEGPRPPLLDLDGATRDNVWHPHDGAWFVEVDGWRKLNVLPSGRPPGSVGLFSGPVEQVAGR